MRIRISSDNEEIKYLWLKSWPGDDVFGAWETRSAFDEAFGRRPCLVIAEDDRHVAGFIALSHIAEEGYYGAFPGETWNGRTWLEQNYIPSESASVSDLLWNAVPEDTVLRYLHSDSVFAMPGAAIDETGYLFIPSRYDFDYQRYWMTFSGKSRKRILREIEGIGDHSCGSSSSISSDIEWMMGTNISSFASSSYFSDPRFAAAFERLLSYLSATGRLEVVTVSVRGKKAAVDVAALFGDRYTVLAGATSPEFPGVAKIINLHHIRRSCSGKFARTDFLCGDFGWKQRFHLSPRDLYVKRSTSSRATAAAGER